MKTKDDKTSVGWLTLGAVLLALADLTPAQVAVGFGVWLVVVFVWNVFSRQADRPRASASSKPLSDSARSHRVGRS